MKPILILKSKLNSKLVILTIFVLVLLSVFTPSFSETKTDYDNRCGLYFADQDSDFSRRIIDSLYSSDFSYQIYTDIELMKADVTGDYIGYCMVINEPKVGEYKNTVELTTTPYSKYTEILKEDFFAIWFNAFSYDLINEYSSKVFDAVDNDLNDKLHDTNDIYINSDVLFDININEISNYDIKENNVNVEHKNELYVFLTGLTVFISALIAAGTIYFGDDKKIIASFTYNNKRKYRIYCILFTLLPLYIIAIILFKIRLDLSFNLFIRFTLLVLYSMFWAYVFSSVVKKEETYIACFPVIILMQFIICPVIIDISAYIPAFKYVKYIFPTGLL